MTSAAPPFRVSAFRHYLLPTVAFVRTVRVLRHLVFDLQEIPT